MSQAMNEFHNKIIISKRSDLILSNRVLKVISESLPVFEQTFKPIARPRISLFLVRNRELTLGPS